MTTTQQQHLNHYMLVFYAKAQLTEDQQHELCEWILEQRAQRLNVETQHG